MRIAHDRRARVPFALIGVLLLVGSVGYAATMGGPDGAMARSDTSQALSEVTAAGRVALRRAVHRAAAVTAANPPIRAANSSYGHVIAGNKTVRRSLRLRIAVVLRQAIDRIQASAGSVTGRLDLPAIDDPATATTALEQVHLTRVSGDRPRLRVTVTNLTATASTAGQRTVSEQYAATVTVLSPVLALHDRATSFESALQNGPLTSGFARGLTARLTAIAMARGWAQYGGADIQNVLSNRHVEVATNGALLATQASTLGAVDTAGQNRHRCAVARTGARSLLAAGGSSPSEWTQNLLADACPAVGNVTRSLSSMAPTAGNRSTAIGYGSAADAAYTSLTDADAGGDSLQGFVSAAFRAELRPVVSQESVSTSVNRADKPSGWESARVQRERSVSVKSENPAAVATPAGWALADRFGRLVTVTTRVIHHWVRGDQRRTTVDTYRERTLVSVAVVGRSESSDESGGGLSAVGREALIKRLGTPGSHSLFTGERSRDQFARRALVGTADRSPISVSVHPTQSEYEAARSAVETLLARLQSLSVSVPRGGLLSNAPADRLREELANRRGTLRSETAPYPSLEALARGAAERAYLNQVETHLASQSSQQRSLLNRLGDSLGLGDLGRSLVGAGQSLLASIGVRTVPGDGIRVRTTPSYLVRTSVNRSQSRDTAAYHPLSIRSRARLSVPWSGLAQQIAGALLPAERTVGLEHAARVLEGAAAVPNQSAGEDARATLKKRVRSALDGLRDGFVTTLVRRDVRSRSAARAQVSLAFQRYNTIHDRAIAATNGSISEHLQVALASDRSHRGEPLGVALRERSRSVRSEVRIPESLVSPVLRSTKQLARKGLERVLETGTGAVRDKLADHWASRALVAVPAGLPITPVPGYWYATANAWTVTVRGGYERVVIEAPTGDPLVGADGYLEYVRRNGSVTMDVDGDGTPEPIGQNSAVSVTVQTGVVVGVPPGGRGVGDVVGLRNETSPGWGDTATDLYAPPVPTVCF